jgi:hypothetical protein
MKYVNDDASIGDMGLPVTEQVKGGSKWHYYVQKGVGERQPGVS